MPERHVNLVVAKVPLLADGPINPIRFLRLCRERVPLTIERSLAEHRLLEPVANLIDELQHQPSSFVAPKSLLDECELRDLIHGNAERGMPGDQGVSPRVVERNSRNPQTGRGRGTVCSYGGNGGF